MMFRTRLGSTRLGSTRLGSRPIPWAAASAIIGFSLLASGVLVAQTPDQALDRLVAAYPGALARHDGERLYWKDGTVMPVSDGSSGKSFDQLLKGASIRDQLLLTYRPGRPAGPPELNDDPGRFRNEAFFQKLYGDCRKGEVDRHMVALTWLPKSSGKTIKATNGEGVADELKKISAEID